jgi:HD-GYP domain-containing protein (c-di-GMP phosphodiesterase class II)
MHGSVHRTLARRLALATFAAAAVVVGVTLAVRWNYLGEVVLDRAEATASVLSAQIEGALAGPGEPDVEALRARLADVVARRRDPTLGRFAAVRFQDREGRPLAEYADEAHPAIGAILERMRQLPPWHGETGRRELLRIDGTPHVWVGIPLSRADGEVFAHAEGVFAPSAETVAAVRRGGYRAMLASVCVVLVTALILYPVIVRLLRRVTDLSMDLLESHLETLKVLGSAVAKRDSDTDAHNYRVTLLSVRIAEALGLDAARIRSLIKGAFLHDVGKIAIPDEILLKPARLTEEEFAHMRRHVDHGVEIVGPSRWLQDALEVVGNHHEKVDGTGYPRGLRGEASPVTARIFAIADVFDALTSRRPYKEPLSLEQAMGILREGRGTHFDPDLFDVFERMADRVYGELSGRDDGGLRAELARVVRRYFSEDTEALAI